MKTIIVTGTPGTGKTTLSKRLAQSLNLHYLDVNLMIKKYNLSEGYDKKRETKIIDTKKLNKAIIKEISNYNKNSSNIKTSKKSAKNNLKTKKPDGIIIDSHLSHYLPKKYADLCIVAKCNLKILQKRLKKKKYRKDKIRENLDAEIFDICLNEAKENKHILLIVDTTKGIDISKISEKVGGLIGIRQS